MYCKRLTHLVLLCILLHSSCSRSRLEVDLIIQGGQVYTGDRTDPFYGDVGILGDSLIVGELMTSVNTIDASGMIVTPGFIDLHAHGDPLNTPEFKNFIAQGITTICLGQDGFSGYLEQFTLWKSKVDSIQPSVNIIPFAGHNSLRLMTDQPYDSALSDSSLEFMQDKLQEYFDSGVFGLSTGLEYDPGYFAGEKELLTLAKTVGKNNGLIMSHMRNEDDDKIEGSILELARQGLFCDVHIAHLKVVYGKGKFRADQILHLIDSANQNGIRVTADLYPYEASYTGFGIVFPDWAKPPNNYPEVRMAREKELGDYIYQRVLKRNGPEAMIIGSGEFAGRTLASVAEEVDQPFQELLMEWGPGGGSAAYFVMDKELQEGLIRSDKVGLSTDGSPTMLHPRGYGSFAKVISQYVVQDSLLTLDEVIYRMTGLPAQILKLNNRGLIKNGYKADLLIFDPENISSNADFIRPHQLSTGFEYVIVNGKVTWHEESLSGRNGHLISRID